MADVDEERLARAIAAIDDANAGDPHRVVVRGERRPKELAHAELATGWGRALAPSASEALLLAARAHHVRRWEIPRESEPEGRAGYHRWRKALHAHHAQVAREVLRRVGYDEATIARVEALVQKKGLGRDPEVQVLEDALCLVFLETQLHDLLARMSEEKGVDVVRKTLRKMSPDAIARAERLPLDPSDKAVLDRAAAAPH